jgi:tetratricopeptide (TPR) repeat protein
MSKSNLRQIHESARQAYETGHLQAALELVQRCLDKDPDDGRAWELCGLIMYSGGDYDESVSALERAQCLIPLRPAGRVCLGHGYGKTGRINLSRDVLFYLIDNEDIPLPLLLQVAIGLNTSGHPELAMQACNRVIQQDQTFSQAYYDLGFYASRCGYPDEMVSELAERAIKLSPSNVQYRIGLAGLRTKHGKFNEAYALVAELPKEALEAVNCVCCLRRVIDLYRRVGDYRRVVICQQCLLSLDSSGAGSDCH